MFELSYSKVSYGIATYEMWFGETTPSLKTMTVEEFFDPDTHEKILEEITRCVGSLSFQEVEARAKFIHRREVVVPLDFVQNIPEALIVLGDGFQVVWTKKEN